MLEGFSPTAVSQDKLIEGRAAPPRPSPQSYFTHPLPNPTPRPPPQFYFPHTLPFLLFQQTAVQSAILFLVRTVDKILQACSVVKNSASTAATDIDA